MDNPIEGGVTVEVHKYMLQSNAPIMGNEKTRSNDINPNSNMKSDEGKHLNNVSSEMDWVMDPST
jgi:hypothetical protein